MIVVKSDHSTIKRSTYYTVYANIAYHAVSNIQSFLQKDIKREAKIKKYSIYPDVLLPENLRAHLQLSV